MIRTEFHLVLLNLFFSCHSKRCNVKVSAPGLALAVEASAQQYQTASWSCWAPGQQPSPAAALHVPAPLCSVMVIVVPVLLPPITKKCIYLPEDKASGLAEQEVT